MRPRGASRQSDDRSSRPRLPVRCAESDECGHEVDAVVRLERSRQTLALLGVEQNAESVAQPLNRRAGDEDRCFERVSCATFLVAGDRRQQTVTRTRNLVSGIEKEKRAGAVGVLRLTRAAASLTEQRRLLITGNSSDRNRLAKERRYSLAKISGGWPHFRQYVYRNVEQVAELLAPAQTVDVKEQGARRVGRISRVHLSAGELPDQPGVDSAREQSSIAGDEGDLRFLEQPLDLCRREIRIGAETGVLSDECCLAAQLQTALSSATILPDDGTRQRLPRVAMPKHNRLALVGDADDIGTHTGCRNRIARRQQCALENLLGIMLDPARLRIVLGDLLVSASLHLTIGG